MNGTKNLCGKKTENDYVGIYDKTILHKGNKLTVSIEPILTKVHY